MASYIRPTPPVPVEIRCVRRQQTGERIGDFFQWNRPNSGPINPVGAVDITTGVNALIDCRFRLILVNRRIWERAFALIRVNGIQTFRAAPW
jgi:hypothetical protein